MQRSRDPRVNPIAFAPDRGDGRAPGLEGTGHLRIAADGTWYHEGRPIPRKELVTLFAKVLRREDDGTYWLKTPVERVRVEVEDAPFVAEELVRRGSGRDQVLAFRTNVDDWVEAGPGHDIRVETSPGGDGPRPYIHIRDGLVALIARSVYYALADLAEPGGPDKESHSVGEASLGVWSNKQFFPLEPCRMD